jgi:hypothetical protein
MERPPVAGRQPPADLVRLEEDEVHGRGV